MAGGPLASAFFDYYGLMEYGTDFPGVARASEAGVDEFVSESNLLRAFPAERFPHQPDSGEGGTRLRRAWGDAGKNPERSYRRPRKIVLRVDAYC